MVSVKVVEPRINIRNVTDTVYINPMDIKLKTFEQFILDVGKRESTNNWQAVNGTMLGYFQIKHSTLKSLGFNLSKEDYLNNKELQIGVFKQLLKSNKKYKINLNNIYKLSLNFE